MAQRTQLDDSSQPLVRKPTPACSPAAWTALVKRFAQRVDYANGYKNKTLLTRAGEVTFKVP